MNRLTAAAARAIFAALLAATMTHPKPGKPRAYYRANGPREVARRRRQIAAGTLTSSNGLVR